MRQGEYTHYMCEGLFISRQHSNSGSLILVELEAVPTLEDVLHLIHIQFSVRQCHRHQAGGRRPNEVEVPEGSNDTLDVI